MPTITDDSFEVWSNVFQSAPPAEQGDSFSLDANVFDNTLTTNESFSGDSNVAASLQSNSIFVTFVPPPPGDVHAVGYLYESVQLASFDVLVAGYLYQNVDDTIPSPHIWYLDPDEGNRGDTIAVVGHGFGELRETYNGRVIFGPTVPMVVSWSLIPAASFLPEDRVIDVETDTVSPEHSRVSFRIPNNAIPADVKILTDTDAVSQPPPAPPALKSGSDSASGADSQSVTVV